MNIKEELFKLQDKKYKDFQAKLFPTLNSKSIIGIRTPELKSLAKKVIKENNYLDFLNDLPHNYLTILRQHFLMKFDLYFLWQIDLFLGPH